MTKLLFSEMDGADAGHLLLSGDESFFAAITIDGRERPWQRACLS
ncbi:hypothetical protein [Dyella solisilvae]|nr:hypothetical protein [Dyella solisilvae]